MLCEYIHYRHIPNRQTHKASSQHPHMRAASRWPAWTASVVMVTSSKAGSTATTVHPKMLQRVAGAQADLQVVLISLRIGSTIEVPIVITLSMP